MKKLAVLVVAGLALAGCGGGGNGSEAPVASNSPACADVWQAGKTLPTDFDGCLDGSSRLVAAVKTNCTDGSELTTYDDRYWAVVGAEVKESSTTGGTNDDPAYAADLATCEG